MNVKLLSKIPCFSLCSAPLDLDMGGGLLVGAAASLLSKVSWKYPVIGGKTTILMG